VEKSAVKAELIEGCPEDVKGLEAWVGECKDSRCPFMNFHLICYVELMDKMFWVDKSARFSPFFGRKYL
jgi:hypothetical protein